MIFRITLSRTRITTIHPATSVTIAGMNLTDRTLSIIPKPTASPTRIPTIQTTNETKLPRGPLPDIAELTEPLFFFAII